MSAIFVRPAVIGWNEHYPFTDVGYEYIAGLTGVWVGPLATRLGVENQKVTPKQLENVHRGKTPDGSRQLYQRSFLSPGRPAHGVNFHSSLDLNALISSQSEPTKKFLERLFFEAAYETTIHRIVPDLYARRGRMGAVRVPAETMAVLNKHVVNSVGHYYLHGLLVISAFGQTPDGRFQSVENTPLYQRQEWYSLDFTGRLMGKFHRQAGIVLTPKLEVKGLEAVRGLKTPRVELIDRRLDELGLPSTPRTRHFASQDTHAPRDPGLTARKAAANTKAWLRANGVAVKRVVARAVAAVSRLSEEKKAERAVRRAVKAVTLLGRPVRASEFETLVFREALAVKASVDRAERVGEEARAGAARYGLLPRADGTLTTRKVERARLRAEAVLRKLARKRPIRPSRHALHRVAVERAEFATHREQVVRAIQSRVARFEDATPAVALLLRAYEADGRRVFGVAAGRTAGQVGRTLDLRVQDPEAFARRLSKKPLLDVALAMRQGPRWRSLRHMEALHRQLRTPELRLQRRDVVVVDTRSANQHAVRFVVQKARKAGATVVWINDAVTPEVVRTQSRNRGRSR